MTVDEELEIIKKVLEGDKDAYEALVLENQKNVYNLAFKMTKNEDDALDISQDAFLKAYLQLENFRGESRFSVWLYRLTYNLCIDFLRKKPRQKDVPFTYQDEEGELRDLEIPDVRSLPEDKLIKKELRETIAESIEELSPAHREILVMREITGMNYGDIAQVLKISEGTVKSRLARARLSLANVLVKKGTFPESYRLNMRKEVE